MTKWSGSARLRRARFALSSLPQRSSGLFSKLICRVEKTPDYWDSNTSPFRIPPTPQDCHTQRVPPHKTSGCTAPSTRKAYFDLPPVAWRKRPTIGRRKRRSQDADRRRRQAAFGLTFEALPGRDSLWSPLPTLIRAGCVGCRQGCVFPAPEGFSK